MLRMAENERAELQETVKFLEQELTKSREQNAALIVKYEQLQDEVQHSHEQIARQASQSHDQLEEIEKLKHEVDNERIKYDSTTTDRLQIYQNELREKNAEIEELRQRLKSSENIDESKLVEAEQNKIQFSSLTTQLSEKEAELQETKNELQNALKQIQDLTLRIKSEGATLLEIEHLRDDNAKLVSLLKRTKEYKEFAEYVEDSSGAIRVPTRSKTPGRRKTYSDYKKDPLDDWVPIEAFRLGQSFRMLNNGPLTDEIINKLLTDLNRIWRERERKQIDRIKTKLTSENADLKRQLAMRVPFDEVQANKHIARLKADIRTIQKDTKSSKTIPTTIFPPKLEVVDETLKMAGSLQRQNAELTEKCEKLQSKVADLENLLKSEEYEKHKFMEGAAWMASRIQKEVSKYGDTLNELIREYNKRTEEKDLRGEIDALFVSSTQAWLLESVDCAFEQLSGKIKNAVNSSKSQSETVGEKLLGLESSIKKGEPKTTYRDELDERIFETGGENEESDEV